MEELGDTVEKLHSMYDLERFITEQERLLKRVPELEEEVRRLNPREDQVAVCFSPSCLFSHEPMASRLAFFALAFQRRAKGRGFRV